MNLQLLGIAYKWNQSIAPYLHVFCRQIWLKMAFRFFLSHRPLELCLRDTLGPFVKGVTTL